MRTLQPLSDTLADAMSGYLPAQPGTVLWGELPCATDRPVVTIDDGESLTIDTISHEGILEDQERDPIAYFTGLGIEKDSVLDDAVQVAAEVPHDPAIHGPHVVTGPIAVRGARPGDVLAMTVEDLTLRCGYGIVSNRHRRGALPDEFPLGGSTETVSVLCTVDEEHEGAMPMGSMPAAPCSTARVRFPLRPFLGIMGVAVADRRRAHSVPPGPHGGNLDVSLLGTGATLYLPVQTDGALAYVGDPHYAQGDGEVALTAFEAPLRARVRFDVIRGAAGSVSARPRLWAETDELFIPIGLHKDLDEAMRSCVRSAVEYLTAVGMHPAHAYAYLSAAGDFAVSQVVDGVKGIHGKIRKPDLMHLSTDLDRFRHTRQSRPS
ncbi:acetamidase/formamidase family protein [Phytoactinopolyspora halotolerans]|uniref:Acetamidase n=1 Tax=Phytoactinopolyspora halotolerans TaxID=1981512 RepID=A0A6L9SID8_9ACTN|nr:acetamidase/formamidase family protein [Phytoactinopolyspora halotolerans]NEE04448.1 acetamidase [Phytoactinopolyspora halotolerans]